MRTRLANRWMAEGFALWSQVCIFSDGGNSDCARSNYRNLYLFFRCANGSAVRVVDLGCIRMGAKSSGVVPENSVCLGVSGRNPPGRLMVDFSVICCECIFFGLCSSDCVCVAVDRRALVTTSEP